MLYPLTIIALASAATCAPNRGHKSHKVEQDCDKKAPNSTSWGLNDAAKKAGKLYFGTATDNYEFKENATYYKQLNNTHDFGQIVPANAQKWETIEASRGVFNFTGGDEVVNLAEANGQLLRCHNTVWHSQLPDWVSKGGFDNATLISIMTNHITKEIEHFKGKCYAWDVLNEALNENGTYRSDVFLDTIGPAYIPIAFATAAKADPKAKLYYNDYNLESPGPKATAAQNIVKLVRSYGAKIDGIGMQSHFQLGEVPTYDQQVAVMKEYASVNVEVAITELDIRLATPGNATEYAVQAEAYYNATAACLSVEKCVGITIWDWTDKYTWVPGVFPGYGDPLPWDVNFVKKPAYDAIMKALTSFKAYV